MKFSPINTNENKVFIRKFKPNNFSVSQSNKKIINLSPCLGVFTRSNEFLALNANERKENNKKEKDLKMKRNISPLIRESNKISFRSDKFCITGSFLSLPKIKDANIIKNDKRKSPSFTNSEFFGNKNFIEMYEIPRKIKKPNFNKEIKNKCVYIKEKLSLPLNNYEHNRTYVEPKLKLAPKFPSIQNKLPSQYANSSDKWNKSVENSPKRDPKPTLSNGYLDKKLERIFIHINHLAVDLK